MSTITSTMTEGAASKDASTVTATAPPITAPVLPAPPPAPAVPVAVAPVAPELARDTRGDDLARRIAEVEAKAKILDEQLARAAKLTEADRERRVMARLRAMGATPADTTLMALAPRDIDPDTAEGARALDEFRKRDPSLFRDITPGFEAVTRDAATAFKVPDNYKGRYDADFASRLLNGAISRMGGK